jgi:predicted HTH domain antitoxin
MPKSFLLSQLEKVHQLKPEEVERSLIERLSQDKGLWREIVTGAYLDGEVSLARAAELLGLLPLDLRQEFLKAGIAIRLGAQTIEEAQAELSAFEDLKGSATSSES